MSIVGYKRAPSEDSPFVEVWRPTCELEDAALPPGEFIYGDRAEAYAAVLAAHPAPEGTFRVKMRDGLIQVAQLPVLDDDLENAFVYGWSNRYFAAAKIADAVAACGKVLVDGGTIEAVRGWRDLSKFPIEVAETPGMPRVVSIVPASPETLKRRAAAAKGVATKAAGTSRAAREKRERKEREEAAERKRMAIVTPIWAAQDALRTAMRDAVEKNLEAKKLPRVGRSFHPTDEWARFYRLLVGRSHRSRPDFKALMRLIDASGADRAHVLGRCWPWICEEYATWAARRGRGRERKKADEAAPAGAGAT